MVGNSLRYPSITVSTSRGNVLVHVDKSRSKGSHSRFYTHSFPFSHTICCRRSTHAEQRRRGWGICLGLVGQGEEGAKWAMAADGPARATCDVENRQCEVPKPTWRLLKTGSMSCAPHRTRLIPPSRPSLGSPHQQPVDMKRQHASLFGWADGIILDSDLTQPATPPEHWHIVSDPERVLTGVTLKKKLSSGIILAPMPCCGLLGGPTAAGEGDQSQNWNPRKALLRPLRQMITADRYPDTKSAGHLRPENPDLGICPVRHQVPRCPHLRWERYLVRL